MIKAFLFGKDADVFEEDTNSKRNNAYIKKLRELWRKKGPIRKFYNLVLYIRVTLQRREKFLDLLKGIVTKNLNVTGNLGGAKAAREHPVCYFY
jgi:quinol monooxygenase YgiN